MILWAVFLLSFSALAFEILLARIFSISQWHHLSFMVISIALLGFASGGVLFSLLDARRTGWEKKWSEKAYLNNILFAFSLSTLFSLFVLSRIPFDYFRLPFEPMQALYLLSLYLVLGIAFFFAGLAVMIGYAACPEKSGMVYFANMAGSACGAAASIPLLPLLGETGAAGLAAIIPLVSVAGDALKTLAGKDSGPLASGLPKSRALAMLLAVLTVTAGSYFLFLSDRPHAGIRPSPYKALSQTLQFPGSRVFKKISSIYGRVDCVESPHLRSAPGLSLKFPSALPAQWVAYRDGDHPVSFYDTQKDGADFAGHTLQYAGYRLASDPGHVLVIQAGGGTAIPCALASGAKQITAVEPNPAVAGLMRAHYGIDVVSDAPRAVLSDPDRTFDVIHVEDWGPSLPGTAALNQDYLLTVEAFADYLDRLSNRGILIVSRRLRLPPSDTLHLWSIAHAALTRMGVLNPGRHILILRNWDTFALIISKSPLKDPAPLVEFSHRSNFDFAFSDPPVSDPVNRYSRFAEPYYHRTLADLAVAHEKGVQDDFFKAYLIDVKPRTDDRPFPDRLLKWDRIQSLYRSTGSRFYTLFMSGEIVVAVVFLEAAIISILFLLVPTFPLFRRNQKISPSHFLYFFFVGAGFMFFEMTFLQAYVLLFGDPVLSFVAVVTGVLLFSGVGGMTSQRLSPDAIQKALLFLVLLPVVGFFFLDPAIHRILKLPPGIRMALAFAVILPIGLPAGLPFALGMRDLLDTPHERAFAWAANGCASVLTAVAAVQTALSLGISTNLLLAAASYLLAWICILRKSPKGVIKTALTATNPCD